MSAMFAAFPDVEVPIIMQALSTPRIGRAVSVMSVQAEKMHPRRPPVSPREFRTKRGHSDVGPNTQPVREVPRCGARGILSYAFSWKYLY